jgi:hypothetical protein
MGPLTWRNPAICGSRAQSENRARAGFGLNYAGLDQGNRLDCLGSRVVSALFASGGLLVAAVCRSRQPERLTGTTRPVSLTSADVTVRSASADIALYGFLISNARFIGVLPEFPAGPSLPEQIPALIQHDLQVPKSLAIGVGRGAVRLPLEEFVLLARKLVDPLVDRRVVHESLLLWVPDVRQSRPPVWSLNFSGMTRHLDTLSNPTEVRLG